MDKKTIWEAIRPYVMILPAMTGILLFVIYPVIYLIYLSFYKYNLMNKDKSKFIGFDNFTQILTREDFYGALMNTVIYTVGVVVLTLILSLIIAVWLNKKSRFNAIVQAGAYGSSGSAAPIGNTYITSVDLNTGDVRDKQLISAGDTLSFREPEGLAIRIPKNNNPHKAELSIGFASNFTPARLANIYSLDRLLPVEAIENSRRP